MFGQLSSTGLALLGFGSFILICLVSHLTKSSRLGDRSTHIVNPVLAMIKSHSGAVVRFVALCGMTAPVLMLVLWTVASLMRPGYDQLSQYGSELGTGPNAIIMNTNFVVTGFLIIALATGLSKDIDGGRWTQIGSILLLVFGAGEVAGGFFPCDTGCPITAQSISQLAHNIDAVIAFVALSFAPLLVSEGLDRDDRWHRYRPYSLITGLLSIGLFFVFSAASLGYLGYVGLFQRLFLAVPFLWIEVVATRLLRISGHDPSVRP